MNESLAIAICMLAAAFIAYELKVVSAIFEVIGGLILVLLMPTVNNIDWFHFMSELGMLALMFVAGFDLEIDQIRRSWQPCSVIGIASFAVTVGGVYAVSHYALGIEPLASGYIAVALSATSLALVYFALKTNFGVSSRPAQIALASASIVDVLCMLSLAVLLQQAVWALSVLVVFVLICVFGLPKVGSLIINRFKGSYLEPELRFLLMILIALMFVGKNIQGLHPAILAFITGIALSSLFAENANSKEKLTGMVFGFLSPLFFIHAGAQMQVTELGLLDLEIIGALLVSAMVLKFLGTYIPAYLTTKETKSWIGILFNYRMTFGLITAQVGIQEGVLTQNMYDAVVITILVSAALTGLLLRTDLFGTPNDYRQHYVELSG